MVGARRAAAQGQLGATNPGGEIAGLLIQPRPDFAKGIPPDEEVTVDDRRKRSRQVLKYVVVRIDKAWGARRVLVLLPGARACVQPKQGRPPLPLQQHRFSLCPVSKAFGSTPR